MVTSIGVVYFRIYAPIKKVRSAKPAQPPKPAIESAALVYEEAPLPAPKLDPVIMVDSDLYETSGNIAPRRAPPRQLAEKVDMFENELYESSISPVPQRAPPQKAAAEVDMVDNELYESLINPVAPQASAQKAAEKVDMVDNELYESAKKY